MNHRWLLVLPIVLSLVSATAVAGPGSRRRSTPRRNPNSMYEDGTFHTPASFRRSRQADHHNALIWGSVGLSVSGVVGAITTANVHGGPGGYWASGAAFVLGLLGIGGALHTEQKAAQDASVLSFKRY